MKKFTLKTLLISSIALSILFPSIAAQELNIIVKDEDGVTKSVLENENITIQIEDQSGNPVNQVNVTFQNTTKYTNNTGETVFSVKQVEENTEEIIYASKDSYESSEKTVDIKNGRLWLQITGLKTFNQVEVNNELKIVVQNYHTNDIVPNVDISFNDEVKQTNNEGYLDLMSPGIPGNYEIIANKTGFTGDSMTVEVTPISGVEIVTNKKYIYKNDEFTVTIQSKSGKPIENAEVRVVNFTDIKKTNEEGKVSFTAPSSVDKFVIYADAVYAGLEYTVNKTIEIKDIEKTDDSVPLNKIKTDDSFSTEEITKILFFVTIPAAACLAIYIIYTQKKEETKKKKIKPRHKKRKK